MLRTWLNFNFDVDEVCLALRWAGDANQIAWHDRQVFRRTAV
ncbi:hypothetical protein [Frankia sp. CiP3]|nr:hypothetical protein [Frankia sp. CiP3]